MAYHPIGSTGWPARNEPPLVTHTLAADLRAMRALLDAGADVNALGRAARPAIYWAASLITKDAPMQLLLEYGADPNMPEDTEDAPILRAACAGELNKVRMLLDAGASPNTLISRQPILCWVAEAGYHDVAQLLIDRGADITARNSVGKQAVHLAARGGSYEMLQVLQRAGADLLDRSEDEEWPLLLAAEKGHIKAVEFLLAAGSPIADSMADDAYWTGLMEHVVDVREVDNLLAVKRLVRSAVISRGIDAALSCEEERNTPSRSRGPGPL